MKMKKLVLFMLVAAISFSLVGCASADYDKAVAAMESGDYETAYVILQEISDYEDSATKIEECKFNLALEAFESKNYDSALELLDGTKNEDGIKLITDCKFMLAIEDSVLDRMETSKESNTSFLTLVNTELAYLEKFSPIKRTKNHIEANEINFYDPNLSKLAGKYVSGLYTQRDALDEEYLEDSQCEWQRGAVERYEVLKTLYEDYGLCNDNNKFIGEYITDLEEQRMLLDAYESIGKTFNRQLKYTQEGSYEWRDYSLNVILENTTKYSFDIYIEYSFAEAINTQADGSFDFGKQFYNGTAYVKNIQPGEFFTVDLYFGSNTPPYYALQQCEWEIQNVQYG